jgi:hypothetical protein
LWTVWNIIRRKVELLIAEEKLEKARQERLFIREMKLFEIHSFIVFKRELIPMSDDACELPTVSAMLTDDAHTVVTEQNILTGKEAIIADITEYRTRIKHQLVEHYVSQLTAGMTHPPDATARSEEEADKHEQHQAWPHY